MSLFGGVLATLLSMDTPTLSTALHNTWMTYQELVKLSRKTPKNRHIHELRVVTQRLEAALVLSSGMTDSKKIDELIQELRGIRRHLGPLRDLYVERKIAQDWPEELKLFYQRKFAKFLKTQIRREAQKDKKYLKDLRLKKQWKEIQKIIVRLQEEEIRLQPDEIQILKENTVEKSAIQVKETLRDLKSDDIKTLHHFRIQSKRLRYQKELVDIKGVDPLIIIQKKVGALMDQRVMTKTLKKFLKANA